MIVATRPDPTVRPPSRYFNPVLSHIFYGFLSKMQWKTADLHHLFLFAWFLGTVLAPDILKKILCYSYRILFCQFYIASTVLDCYNQNMGATITVGG